QSMDGLSAKPRPTVANPSRSEGRGTEGVFSLVTFSCTSKRKSRAGQDGRQDPQGRESVIAQRPRDQKSKWIPAFAEMTK
ncbi:MAG TPA: hypothetical protein VJ696_00285, partial [Rhodanobacteraceae bacterium]|nr:hypothetical protein [Rhodanobacteraceae bacterium]